MICFICKINICSLKLLIYHFKRNHDIKTNSLVRCTEFNCGQSFQNIISFKRHVNRKHLNVKLDITLDVTDKPTEKQEIHNNLTCSLQQPLSQNEDSNSPIFCPSKEASTESLLPNPFNVSDVNFNEENQNEFKFNKELFDKIITEFVLYLHNNDNFSRKDVFKIQEFTNQFLIEPILNMFVNFAKCNFQENLELYNDFCSLVSNFRNPFKNFSSDHLLFKLLNNQGYADVNVKEFTIENIVQPMRRGGNLVTDEKKNIRNFNVFKISIENFF